MQEQPQAPNNTADKIVTLKCFIDDHQKMLAVIGVFIGLSVFSNNFSPKSIGSIISFLSLAATIPLFIEIYRRFDYRKSSWLLIIFLNIFSPLAGYTLWYVLIGYRSQWQTQMKNLVFWAFAIPMWMLYKGHIHERVHAWAFDKLVLSYRRKFRKSYEDRAKVSREKLERNLDDPKLTEEHKQERRENFEKLVKDTLESDFYTDKAPASDVQRRKRVKLVTDFLALFIILIVCSLITNPVATVINAKLDKMSESYKAAEPSPEPVPTQMVAPSASPTPALVTNPMPSPEATATPSLEARSLNRSPKPSRSRRARVRNR